MLQRPHVRDECIVALQLLWVTWPPFCAPLSVSHHGMDRNVLSVGFNGYPLHEGILGWRCIAIFQVLTFYETNHVLTNTTQSMLQRDAFFFTSLFLFILLFLFGQRRTPLFIVWQHNKGFGRARLSSMYTGMGEGSQFGKPACMDAYQGWILWFLFLLFRAFYLDMDIRSHSFTMMGREIDWTMVYYLVWGVFSLETSMMMNISVYRFMTSFCIWHDSLICLIKNSHHQITEAI